MLARSRCATRSAFGPFSDYLPPSSCLGPLPCAGRDDSPGAWPSEPGGDEVGEQGGAESHTVGQVEV
jgi:hypothetical protein